MSLNSMDRVGENGSMMVKTAIVVTLFREQMFKLFHDGCFVIIYLKTMCWSCLLWDSSPLHPNLVTSVKALFFSKDVKQV